MLVTSDDALLDDVLRLAAAAGVDLDVAHDAQAALRGWVGPQVVLVGADLLGAVTGLCPPRREQVHVLSGQVAGDALFREAVAVGAQDVVELPAAEGWVVELLTDVGDDLGRGVGRARTIGVLPGSGGAGATTFACALGRTAASRGAVVLADLDPFGPGVEKVAGFEDVGGISWADLVETRGRLGSRSLRAALPQRDGLALLTWGSGPVAPLDPRPVREALTACQRGNSVVVVDLPRSLDAVALEAVARCDMVVVVAAPRLPAVAAAAKVTVAVRAWNSHLGLVVREAAGGVPAEQVARVLDLPLLATVRHQRRLAEQIDLGLGAVHSSRGPLARAARTVLDGAFPVRS
jgi:secretion/DNA translocation related CpaE-like protein